MTVKAVIDESAFGDGKNRIDAVVMYTTSIIDEKAWKLLLRTNGHFICSQKQKLHWTADFVARFTMKVDFLMEKAVHMIVKRLVLFKIAILLNVIWNWKTTTKVLFKILRSALPMIKIVCAEVAITFWKQHSKLFESIYLLSK